MKGYQKLIIINKKVDTNIYDYTPGSRSSVENAEYYLRAGGREIAIYNFENEELAWYLFGKERVTKTEHLLSTGSLSEGIADRQVSWSEVCYLLRRHIGDSDVGRFLSLDPLAAEYPEWSDYNYVLGNPIRFIDPDGKAPNDIILGKRGKLTQKWSKDLNRNNQKTLLKHLQVLTNDKLGMTPTGEVFILRKNATGNGLPDGTQLIRDLIEAPKNVRIDIANVNGTNPVNEEGDMTETSKENSRNGEGTDSDISYNPLGKGEKILNEDGTMGRPAVIGLVHELLHSKNHVNGTSKTKIMTGLIDPDDKTGKELLSLEELNIRKAENKIRKERFPNKPKRAIPEGN